MAEKAPREAGALLQPLQLWPPLRLVQPHNSFWPTAMRQAAPLHPPSCLVAPLVLKTRVAMVTSSLLVPLLVLNTRVATAEGLAMVVVQPPSSCPILLLDCLCPCQHRALLQVRIPLYLLVHGTQCSSHIPVPAFCFHHAIPWSRLDVSMLQYLPASTYR